MILGSKHLLFMTLFAFAGSSVTYVNIGNDDHRFTPTLERKVNSDNIVIKNKFCQLERPEILIRNLKEEGIVHTLKPYEKVDTRDKFFINNRGLFSH